MIKIGENYYKEIDIEDLSKNELIELVSNPDQEEIKKKNGKIYRKTDLKDISKQELIEYIENLEPEIVIKETYIDRYSSNIKIPQRNRGETVYPNPLAPICTFSI